FWIPSPVGQKKTTSVVGLSQAFRRRCCRANFAGMTKQEIAAVFEEIGILLDLQGANPFRVRAYANAARTIESLQQDIDTLVKEERLTEIKGIGDDLAKKITELHTTGKLAFYDEL